MKQGGLAALAVAIPFLVPLALTPHLLFYYDITPKVALLMLAAALGLALAFKHLDAVISFWGRPTGRGFCVAVVFSLLVSGISTLRSAEVDLSWYGSNWRRLGTLTECAVVLAAFWIALNASRSQRHLTLLLRSICAAGLLASLYGIAQYFAWDPVLPAAAYESGEGIFRIVRPPSTLGHSDYFSAFLLWPVFAGAALIAFERSPAWRFLAISTAVAGPVAILLSGSRGALLGLVAGAVVQMLLARPKPRIIGGVVLIAAIIITGFYISPAGGRLRARVHWVEEEPAGGARLLLWRDSLRLAAARPVIGAGADSFVAEFPKFQSVELARAYPDFFHESPHNLLLDTLANQGALGLLALLAVAAAGIAGGVRAQKLSPLLALALLPGLVATLIVHQFAVFIAPTAFYFYLAAGTLAGARADDLASPLIPNLSIPTLWRYAVFAAGMPCAVWFSLAAYQLLAEDHTLAQVRKPPSRRGQRKRRQRRRIGIAGLSTSRAPVSARICISPAAGRRSP